MVVLWDAFAEVGGVWVVQDHAGVGIFAGTLVLPLQHFKQRIHMTSLMILKAPPSYCVTIGLD